MGRRRQGKSTLALYTAMKISEETGCGIFIFDPNAQYKRFRTVHTVSDLLTAIEEAREAKKIEDRIIVYRPLGDVQEEWEQFADAIWPFGNYVVIIDEAHNIQKPTYIDLKLSRLIRQAPTDTDAPETVHILQNVHRPSDTHGLVRSQATHFYIFRSTLPADLDVLEDNCGTEVAEIVSSLPKHHYLIFDVDKEEYTVVNNPESWKIELKGGAVSQNEPEDIQDELLELLDVKD